nr:hypothetical protein BaRGS_011826 [Batillaria attramentaria]
MASGGKKKSKNKGKTLNLNEFLANEDGTVPVPVVTKSWAAEMESADIDDGDEQRPTFDRSKLPTAPKAARGPDVNMSLIPSKPPYTAFVGNLPYDASEEKIAEFFEKQHNLEVVNVRLPNENGRQRGFGYVEFKTKESLVDALTLNESMFAGRKLRVDLAEQSGGEGRDNRSDRDDWRGGGGDPSRTEGDWRRRDAPPAFSDDRGRGFGDRDRGDRYNDRQGDRGGGFSDRGFSDRGDRFGDRDRDSGRGFSDRYGDRDRGFSDRYSERDRGFGGDRRGDRDHGFSDRYGDRDRGSGRYGDREGGYGGGRDDRDWSRRDGDRYGGDRDDRYGGGRRGFGGNRDGDRFGRSDRDDDRGGFGGRRPYGGGYRRDGSGNRDERPTSRETSQDAPRERPKLQLQPRTKPVEPAPAPPDARPASIFGSAKPVDTTKVERYIEKKMEEMDVTLHYSSEQSHEDNKENRTGGRDVPRPRRDSDNRPRRDSDPRPRRDSDRSDSSRGRERRSSGSSSKTGHSGPVRRDSETSRTSDDSHPDRDVKPTPPKHEDVKMVPAPPPKENAWSRPRPALAETPKQGAHPTNKSTPADGGRRDDDRHDDGRGGYGRGRPDDHNDDRYSDRRDGKQSAHRRNPREKPLPKSIDEMPKLDQGPAKDWSDTNKFASLGGSDTGFEEEEDEA